MPQVPEDDPHFNFFAEHYLAREEANESPTTEELERIKQGLRDWYSAGQKLVSRIESGLEEASVALFRYMQSSEADPHGLIQLTFQQQLVIVPSWFKYYPQARATVSRYLAATGKAPL